ncbi:LexA family protein [Spirosoma endbachense]|uniref:DNA repair protein n=1 Tax=Spirosoma endbachense TaxID=2666025 RepID=A0A6P1W1J0_9BACT|nr:S24 family peptidase [Spirosoma endbachense]QHV97887.1 DNA repair protein [Spirosoma endbachense]
MIDTLDPIPPGNIWAIDPSERVPIPFYLSTVQAGFPNPAENFLRQRLNLQDLCVQHPDATYFVEAAGESMIEDYIYPGSILVVDAALLVESGKIIVCWVNGACTVKRFVRYGKLVVLFPSNAHYTPLYIHPETDQFLVLGVVVRIVSKPPRWDSDQLKTAQDYVRTHRRE